MKILRFSTAAALVLGLASPLLGMKVEKAPESFETAQNRLFQAIRSEDLATVKNLVTKKVNVSKAWEESSISAYPEGVPQIIEEYAAQVDVDEAGADGITPLALAIGKNNFAIVNVLLKNGANPFKGGKFTAEQNQPSLPLVQAAMFAGVYYQGNFQGNGLMISTIVEAQNKNDIEKSKESITKAMEVVHDYNTNYIHTQRFDPDANNVALGLKKNYDLLKTLLEKLSLK